MANQKVPAMPPQAEQLDATDKALITYYAFIALADSVSAHSETMLGKHFTSRDIQILFAQEAIKELRKDGLLHDPKVIAPTRFQG